MDSSIKPTGYGTSMEVRYGAHYIELVSDKVSFDNPKGKFIMKYLTPNIKSEIMDTTLPKNSTDNVINSKGNNLGIAGITTSNYIELNVPQHLFYIESIKIEPNPTKGEYMISCNPQAKIIRKEFYKGQKFVIMNTGNGVDKPCIIGVSD